MKNMNIKNIVVAILIILFGWSAKGQDSLPTPPAGNEISVRFVPLASGGPKWLKAKTVNGDVVKIGNQKMYVDKILLTQLNKRRSVNYWYSIKDNSFFIQYKTRSTTSPSEFSKVKYSGFSFTISTSSSTLLSKVSHASADLS